jgi:hypothetical protein
MLEEFSNASLYFHILPKDLHNELLDIFSDQIKISITKMRKDYIVGIIYFVSCVLNNRGVFCTLKSLDSLHIKIDRYTCLTGCTKYSVRVYDMPVRSGFDIYDLDYIESICLTNKLENGLNQYKLNND